MLGNLLGKKQVSETIGIVDKMITDKDEKNALVKDIIDSENKSGSAYTRNARPTILYFGLLVIFSEIFGLRYFFLTKIDVGMEVISESTSMVRYFIFTWGGLSAVYNVGRSFEKKKMKFFNKE